MANGTRAEVINVPFIAPTVDIKNITDNTCRPLDPRNPTAAFAATGAAFGNSVELEVTISVTGKAWKYARFNVL